MSALRLQHYPTHERENTLVSVCLTSQSDHFHYFKDKTRHSIRDSGVVSEGEIDSSSPSSTSIYVRSGLQCIRSLNSMRPPTGVRLAWSPLGSELLDRTVIQCVHYLIYFSLAHSLSTSWSLYLALSLSLSLCLHFCLSLSPFCLSPSLYLSLQAFCQHFRWVSVEQWSVHSFPLYSKVSAWRALPSPDMALDRRVVSSQTKVILFLMRQCHLVQYH